MAHCASAARLCVQVIRPSLSSSLSASMPSPGRRHPADALTDCPYLTLSAHHKYSHSCTIPLSNIPDTPPSPFVRHLAYSRHPLHPRGPAPCRTGTGLLSPGQLLAPTVLPPAIRPPPAAHPPCVIRLDAPVLFAPAAFLGSAPSRCQALRSPSHVAFDSSSHPSTLDDPALVVTSIPGLLPSCHVSITLTMLLLHTAPIAQQRALMTTDLPSVSELSSEARPDRTQGPMPR
ncbi:hypothetical protein AcV7_008972 [Taiwanofungus camphoratus]|nr:hypothetical protein AcV7_008972 [Antrodia cinnamomea]